MEDYRKHPIWITPKEEMTLEIEVPIQPPAPAQVPAPPPADQPKADEPRPPGST